MKYLGSLMKSADENWSRYFSRLRYAGLRRLHPKYREQYRLEKLVGPENCWDELLQYQFNILMGVGVRPHHSFLDIGCGALTTGLKLIPYLDRGKYVGVDLRPEPLIEAHRLIAKHALAHKNPSLINSQTFGQEEIFHREFDFVWMSQLSYHLDDVQMVSLFEQVCGRLKPDGLLVFDILSPDRTFAPGSQWSGFAFRVRPLDYYSALSRRFGFSMETKGRISEFGYPKRIDLHTNILLTLSKSSARAERAEGLFNKQETT